MTGREILISPTILIECIGALADRDPPEVVIAVYRLPLLSAMIVLRGEVAFSLSEQVFTEKMPPSIFADWIEDHPESVSGFDGIVSTQAYEIMLDVLRSGTFRDRITNPT